MIDTDSPANQAIIHDLVIYLTSDGHFGEIPAWFPQWRYSELLRCSPWVIDDVFPEHEPVSHQVWCERAAIVQQAMEQAQNIMMRKKKRFEVSGNGVRLPLSSVAPEQKVSSEVLTLDAAGTCSDSSKDRASKYTEALREAILIIEGYQLDIRTHPELVQQGFCQGVFYREAVKRVRKLAGQQVEEIAGDYFEARQPHTEE